MLILRHSILHPSKLTIVTPKVSHSTMHLPYRKTFIVKIIYKLNYFNEKNVNILKFLSFATYPPFVNLQT
jgi:hypothetical protein